MGNERMAWSWRHGLLKSSLPPTTRHVLLTLSCHVNDAGEACFPSVEVLAAETGLTTRAVKTHLQLGREAGWIEVDRHGFSGQKWARNQYTLRWPEMPEGGEGRSPPFAEGGEGRSPKVVKDVHHLQGPHIYGFSHVLPIPLLSPTETVGAVQAPFDQFWTAWPAGPNKKRKAEVLRIWERMKLDKLADVVVTHVRKTIVDSEAARNGGQYVVSPRRYLQAKAWEDAAPAAAPAPGWPTLACARCGEHAAFKLGGTPLCATHFREVRKDD